MWDDATALQGRHTKRKWKTSFLLLLAAIMILLAALAAQHPDAIKAAWKNILSKFSPEPSNAWVAADYTIQAQPVFLGDSVFYVDRGWGSIVRLDGTAVSRTALDTDIIVQAGACAGSYSPGGSTLAVARNGGFQSIVVPSGIDAAAVSDRGFSAVITSGSGYLTLTQVYDPAGTLVKEIGLTDSAMVFSAFLRGNETLVSCTVDKTGTWRLRFDGDETMEYPLETDMVYALKPCGDGAALWTGDGLRFYGGAGEQLGQMPCEPLLDWDCDGFVAALTFDGSAYRLSTMDQTGKIVVSEPLPRIPRQVSVCGNTVCVLDSEALLVYDKQCHLETTTSLGALAVSVQADYGGAVLFGDGEFMRFIP